MMIRNYLIEKFYVLFLTLMIAFFVTFFLFALDVSFAGIFLILTMIIFLGFSFIIVEFLKRYHYMVEFNKTLAALDQKYLICDLIKEPQFIDGKIFYDALQSINKSMLENIQLYKASQKEYQEYIETWVHEIKTPLAAAKLVVQNHQNEIGESILQELEQMERWIDQALYYARSANPQKDYFIREINIENLIQAALKKLSKQFIYKKIKVDMQNLDQKVYGDQKWILFILDQIMMNALQYMEKEKGIMRIYCETLPHAILLHVEDNGIGIHANELERIFDKGFTGTNGRIHQRSTGIGLYLCKLLCQKLYLDIQVSSTWQKGSDVIITFPLSNHIQMFEDD